MNIIEALEKEQIAKLNKQIPEFQPGDTVRVNVKVERRRARPCAGLRGRVHRALGGGLNESFTVRKISWRRRRAHVSDYSPMIDSVKVVRRGKVRRAKLYYLRDRRGKSARIAERGGARRQGDGRLQARQRAGSGNR